VKPIPYSLAEKNPEKNGMPFPERICKDGGQLTLCGNKCDESQFPNINKCFLHAPKK